MYMVLVIYFSKICIVSDNELWDAKGCVWTNDVFEIVLSAFGKYIWPLMIRYDGDNPCNETSNRMLLQLLFKHMACEQERDKDTDKCHPTRFLSKEERS